MRYLTGLPFDESEVTGSGDSGKFLVGLDDVWVVADSRYTIAVKRDAPDTTLFEVERPARRLLGGPRRDRRREARRDRGDDDPAHHLGEAARGRARRRARADRGLGRGRPAAQGAVRAGAGRGRVARSPTGRSPSLLPSIRPGVTEKELALDLEWRIRTGGADRLAFDVACLAGAEAALPHGSPGDRPGRRRARSSCSTSAPRSRATGAT